MDNKYHQAYNDLYVDYAIDFRWLRNTDRLYDFSFWEKELSEEQVIRSIRRAIEQVEITAQSDEEASEYTLRIDAKFFLLVNFHLMVIRPLMIANNRYWDPSRAERMIGEMIYPDVEKILARAYELARESDKNEVSGHLVMQAIDEMWSDLEVSSFRIWGKGN